MGYSDDPYGLNTLKPKVPFSLQRPEEQGTDNTTAQGPTTPPGGVKPLVLPNTNPDVDPNASKDDNKVTVQHGLIDMGEADRMAQEMTNLQMLYGKPIRREEMTDRTRRGIQIADQGMEEARNMNPMSTYLLGNQALQDAQKQAIDAAASGATGAGAWSGGEVSNNAMAATQIANATMPVAAQFGGQRAQLSQDLLNNQMNRNNLIEQRNQDAISHSNTREMINEDHPLKALLYQMQNKRNAMGMLADQAALQRGEDIFRYNPDMDKRKGGEYGN
jgi:hypothetical protein